MTPGSPWTSEGCQNCRKRKIKCDQQKPQCGKCAKRGLTCPGYRGKLFFQHTFTQTGNPEDGPGEIQSGLEVDLSPEVALPPTINAAPQIRQQISSSYMDSWFPSSNLPEPGTDIYYPVGDWNWLFTNFLQLSSNSPMLEEAVVAVSSISLGKMNRDDSLVHRGVASYNQSIRLMSNMIQQNMLTEDLLFATVTFQMIETVNCSNGLGTFISHMNGSNALLERLFTSGYSSPILQMILENQRRLVIATSAPGISSSRGVSPLLLQSPEQSPFDQAMQFLANISSLRTQAEDIGEQNNQAGQEVCNACLTLRGDMLTWYSRNKDSIGGYPSLMVHDEPLSADLLPAEHLFGTPYYFANFENARIHILYWSGLLALEDIVGSEEDLAEHYADEICRSIPYFIKSRRGTWGTSTMIGFVIQIIRPYIRLRHQEKFEYCQSFLQNLAEGGLGMASTASEILMQWWMSYPGSPPGGSVTDL